MLTDNKEKAELFDAYFVSVFPNNRKFKFIRELEKQDERIGLKFKIGRSIVRGYLFILNEFKYPFQEIRIQLW